MGGVDKVTLPLAGRSSLDRLLDGCAGAGRVVGVGPVRETARPVTWCREEPPGSGPLAAVAAGVPHTGAAVVVVVAGDMPSVGSELGRLVAALDADPAADAAALRDPGGRLQPLAAAFRRDWLERRLAEVGDPTGRPAMLLLDGARVVAVPAQAGAADVDTWDDVDRIEGELGRAR
jgi:molybdopterin-guanine dinucleotide biosynthesis protein A